MKYHTPILILIILIYLTSTAFASSDIYLETNQKTNYSAGIGNISYPSIVHQTENKSFGNSLLVVDIDEDGQPEIVGASLLENTLFVYNSTLSPMWNFEEKNASEWSDLNYGKITALAVGDIDGDEVPEIIFSMAPSICPIASPIKIENPTSVIYAFKADGTLLWDLTVSGGITQESLEISDINQDGKKEIIAGATNLYLISENGTILSEYSLSDYAFRGISEITTRNNEIVFTFWHYPESRESYNNFFRVYNSFYSIKKISFSNNSFQEIWNLELENDDSISSAQYQRFFATENLSFAYILNEYISPSMPDSLVYIDLTNGEIRWSREEHTMQQTGIGVAVLKNEVVWNAGNRIMIFNSYGEKIEDYKLFENTSTNKMVRPTISIFDIDGDEEKEMVFVDANYIYALNMKTGNREWKVKLWDGSYICPIDAPIIHSDTDNDGFDEIITTDPEGRIVIIDSGTPPNTEEPETIAGMGTIGMAAGIMTASALIWVWRKRRDEK